MNILSKYWVITLVFLHVLAVWASVGHYHDDEYFQILDFAALKLGFVMQDTVMWEYQLGIRSGFQPFIAYTIVKVLSFFNITSPFVWAFYLRLLSTIFSLVSIILFCQVAKREINSTNILHWTTFFLLFSWIQIFLNVRFSSEGWSTSLFIIAYSIYFCSKPLNIKRYFYVGLLLGFSFLARYQIGFLLFGLSFWVLFFGKETKRSLLIICLGFIIALFIGVIIDYWLYGTLTFSAWEYFEWHIIKGSLDSLTSYHQPWWFYIHYSALQLVPPITLFLPVVVVVFWILFYRHPITWVTVPIVLFHHYFPHKEMRFLFPVIPFIPVMFAMSIDYLVKRFEFLNENVFKYSWKFILYISLLINLVLVLLTITLPASKEVALWQNCFTKYISSDSILLVYDRDGSGSDTGELELDFYNTNDIPIISINSESEILDKIIKFPDKQLFYAARKKGRASALASNGISNHLICQALPEWILKININDWTSRASIWQIWEIKK
jgi:phosphatidylinositol glycan class B